MAKVTKTALAIATMNANTDKPMEAVIPLIAEASGVPLNIARNYYVWCVRKGVATGVVPVKARKPKKDKLVEAVKREGREHKKAQKAKAKVAAPTKSPEEIERIRAANLARLKEVGARFEKPKQPEAEVDTVAEHDSFAAPAFLTKEEVVALV